MRPAKQTAVCFSNKNLIIIESSRNIVTTVPENLSKMQLLDADIIIVIGNVISSKFTEKSRPGPSLIVVARLLEDPS
jgi:hypothetical protein